jgi:hypothetical protein
VALFVEVSLTRPLGLLLRGLRASVLVDALDKVVARYSAVAGSNLYHSQTLPGLTLAATGGKIPRFRVTDAGDPIAGARVSVGGRNLVTDGTGRASVDLRPGRYTAAASKSGYVGAAKRVRVR